MIFDKLGNLAGMMKQAKALKDEMENARYEAEKDGVQVLINGEMEILELKIPTGVAENAVKDAVNHALKSAKDDMFKRFQKMAGGMALPGIL